jgi:uncharacterized membrane protein YesL
LSSSPYTISKTERHDKTEILLKVALSIYRQTFLKKQIIK